ncbi:AmpG family muropeptide MFS transporter [Asticcacaulis sp. 201]|uniref:AmpG family muropeptide MFS transporter n=1 Tax=Asticcacaulis sp. 201 TaxID=3028787 RepID=UPI002915FC48|nr:permease [Asticcacaulis sp. 201]MDV6329581.1 permease [Asticcacaulis sp. 201]
MIAADTKPTLKTRLNALIAALRQPSSWLLLALGFSCALPFLLVGGTLSFWLRSEHISLTLITFTGWVSLLYGFKFAWAPWMDKVHIPLLYGWLGQRRSYMVLSQAGIATGLVAMALIGPHHLIAFLAAAVFVAFSAASQEIAVDAWRVEQTRNDAEQALNPSLYAYGFRAGILVTDSLILVLSKRIGWPLSYTVIACLLGIGLVAALLAHRTEAEQKSHDVRSFRELVVDPFTSFFQEHKNTAGLILLTLALYRLPDYLTILAGTMYVDTGLDPDAIAAMRAGIGLWASLIGIAAGGGCLLIFGLKRTFILGALIGPVSNLCFSWMSIAHGDLRVFAFTLLADNFSNGIAETALVAFMTRMTGRDHTLTHYALMYSVAALTGKFLKGFTGLAVDALTQHLGLFNAYSTFFMATAAIGVPCLILCWILSKKRVFSIPPAE